MSDSDRAIKSNWSKKLGYFFAKAPQTKQEIFDYLLEQKLINTLDFQFSVKIPTKF